MFVFELFLLEDFYGVILGVFLGGTLIVYC